MPTHDWTRVDAGTFHDLHLAWIAVIQQSLNTEILPDIYYAQASQLHHSTEQVALSDTQPDAIIGAAPGFFSTVTDPPVSRMTAAAELEYYVLKCRTLVIRHSSDDRVIALIEIVSPGNKASWHALRSFVEKAVEALYRCYHLLVIDLFPPGRETRRASTGRSGARSAISRSHCRRVSR